MEDRILGCDLSLLEINKDIEFSEDLLDKWNSIPCTTFMDDLPMVDYMVTDYTPLETHMNIKKLNSEATTPKYAHEYDAGFDLCSATSYTIIVQPNQVVKIGTGLAMEIPVGHFGAIFPRSGLSTNEGLVLANTVGIVDSNYRGEVIVPIKNTSSETRYILPHERVAQMIIMPYKTVKLDVVDELSDTDRGEGGFGSSGKN